MSMLFSSRHVKGLKIFVHFGLKLKLMFNMCISVDLLLCWFKHLVITIIMLLCTVLLWQLYNVHQKDRRSVLPLPPGHFGLPVVGETLSLLLQGTTFLDNKQKLYGDIYVTHLFGQPTIRVIGADNVSVILNGKNDFVASNWPASARILLKGGLIVENSERRHNHRKCHLMQALKQDSLSRYTPKVAKIIDAAIDNWYRKYTDPVVYMYTELQTLIFDIVCSALLGFDTFQQHENHNEEFKDFLNGIFSIPFNIPGFTFYKACNARTRLLEMIKTNIEKQKADGYMRKLLSAMTADTSITADDMASLCLDVLFAGHTTTASAATSMIVYLHKNPHVKQKLREELELYSDANGGDVSMNTLKKLPYLHGVVMETLRLSPPIGAGYRKVVRTFEIGGYQIPKGWSVVYSIRESQVNSNKLIDHLTFDPERWNPETNSADETKYLLAFGGGKRRCPGMAFAMIILKILAIKLTTKCHIQPIHSHVYMSQFPLPHPPNNLPVFVKRLTPTI